MDNVAAKFDIEDYTGRIAVNLEKIQYLTDIISQKLQKQIGKMNEHEKDCFVGQHDNLRINLDIVDDYIHDAINILNELRGGIGV